MIAGSEKYHLIGPNPRFDFQGIFREPPRTWDPLKW